MTSTRPVCALLAAASSSLRLAPPSAAAALVRPSACAFSAATTPRTPEHEAQENSLPRWQQTPPRMKAPFRIRPQARGGVLQVNKDPRRLDDAYIRLLGPDGDKVLRDEVKWLAVTHKSYDHGRQGFNDRLAFLGTRPATGSHDNLC